MCFLLQGFDVRYTRIEALTTIVNRLYIYFRIDLKKGVSDKDVYERDGTIYIPFNAKDPFGCIEYVLLRLTIDYIKGHTYMKLYNFESEVKRDMVVLTNK